MSNTRKNIFNKKRRTPAQRRLLEFFKSGGVIHYNKLAEKCYSVKNSYHYPIHYKSVKSLHKSGEIIAEETIGYTRFLWLITKPKTTNHYAK